MPRLHWHDLPVSVLSAAGQRIGHVAGAAPVTAGSIADLASVLDTPDGKHFCKGIRVDNPNAWMYRNEARINAHLPGSIVPSLRWQLEHDGWLLLGFDFAEGHHANLSVGSADLSLVALALTRLSEALTPCPVERVQPAAVRWGGRLSPEHVEGNSLVHTDVTPRNFLLGDSVAVVDW